MGAIINRPQLVAVDANVLFDLAAELDDVVDAVSVIRQRLRDARLLLPPSVQNELTNWALRGGAQKRESARKASPSSDSARDCPEVFSPVTDKTWHGVRNVHGVDK